ncbi:hypothetical protein PJP14_29350, partial [Mycobacterium kansasii]
MPSPTNDPKLDLKPLPNELKYVYLGENETYPVVISSFLDKDQETKLLNVLRAHKGALGLTISDIEGISPSISTHQIHLNEDVKPI